MAGFRSSSISLWRRIRISFFFRFLEFNLEFSDFDFFLEFPIHLQIMDSTDDGLDRALGLMYGLVVGDALGARYEFRKASTVDRMMRNALKSLQTGKQFLLILGGKNLFILLYEML